MKTLKAYKLFTLHKDGKISSLFINKKRRLPLNKWLKSECFPTKRFAVRPGWHSMSQKFAPHLKENGRIWAKIEIKDYKIEKRPKNQGDTWYLSKWMKIKEICLNS